MAFEDGPTATLIRDRAGCSADWNTAGEDIPSRYALGELVCIHTARTPTHW